jgi:ribose transport system permease protein
LKKVLGILGLLVAICAFTAIASDRFLTTANVVNLLQRTALFGIISVGAAFVIMTGGIDLSIGSVICLVGCLLPWLLVERGWPPGLALPAVLVLAGLLGLAHGLLITRLRLQPFVVTLCGLLLYRGVTRGITDDQTQGLGLGFEGLKTLATGRIPIAGDFALPAPVLALAAIALVAWLVLERTVFGRYLIAVGRNEEAARYSGVDTGRVITAAYVICALLAGFGGVLFVLDVNSAQASNFGSFYELYAIAGAVLGGCALRGGEGTVLGVVIGASVMQVLGNTIRLVEWIPNQLEFAVIGAAILAGAVVDELVKRVAARRRIAR